ncbi:MAG: hypothetical protein ACI4SO_05585 [Muribaculaceae bacterium]
MATTATARGQITIVDLNDAKQIQLYLENSGADTQIYNPDTKAYTPSYTSAPITITPKVFITGSADDQFGTSDITSVKWYVDDALISTGNTSYVINDTKTLTIKKNITGNFLRIKCEVVYTDPLTSVQTVLNASKTITKNMSGGAIYTVMLSTPQGTVFNTNKGGTKIESLTAVATAYRGATKDTSQPEFHWYKLVGGSWSELTSDITLSNNVSTLAVSATDVLNFQTYKVTAIDKQIESGQQSNTAEALVTFTDMTDPFQVEMVSTTGDKILNGQGETKIFARIWQNGELVEDSSALATTATNNKFLYKWTIYNSGGTQIKWTNGKDFLDTFTVTVTAALCVQRCTVMLEVTRTSEPID